MKNMGALCINRLCILALLVCGIFLSLIFSPSAYADWTSIRADSSNSGVATGNPVLTPKQIWNYTTPGEPVISSPVVANGTVYIGLWDGVYAFKADNGALLWKYKIYQVYASPAVANGVVYIGANYSLNTFNAANGDRLWTFPLHFTIYSSPTIVDGVVYFGCSGISGAPDTRFYALNATTGAQLWNLTLSDNIYSPPAVSKGVVYISAGSEDPHFYAVNSTNGAELWKHQFEFGGSPSIANGVVYAGTVDWTFYALNATSGADIWSFNASGTEASGQITRADPAVAQGVVYIGSVNGNLYALNASTGAKLWNSTIGGVVGSPTVGSGVLYVASTGKMHALNVTDGSKLWSLTAPQYHDNGYGFSSPAVDNGVLYVSSSYGSINAFDNLGNPAPTPTPAPTATQTTSTGTPTPKPTPTPSPAYTTIPVNFKKSNGENVTLNVNGNITNQQISNAIIQTNPSKNTTTLSFTLTGQSGSTGFANVTIPKTAVPYGTTSTVWVDNLKAENQGYSQDASSYYVWYTIHFSTYEISIVFEPASTPEPSAATDETQTQANGYQTIIVVAAALAIAATVVAALTVYLRKTGNN